ncbi:hypothetical protein GLYMA_13G038150v4 [Glycine max]|nr:hypothetical protein GLYMA_13G038150v4 [Glycine max]KAH1099697.1 hypothetical protein GYH30_035050 [Glycine max]
MSCLLKWTFIAHKLLGMFQFWWHFWFKILYNFLESHFLSCIWQLENYQTKLEEMKNMSRQKYVAHLRRKSSGFSRGASMYRGVARHHQHGRWQARIARVAGNKELYLGTFRLF